MLRLNGTSALYLAALCASEHLTVMLCPFAYPDLLSQFQLYLTLTLSLHYNFSLVARIACSLMCAKGLSFTSERKASQAK
jgi:hypothetical protein